MKNISRRTAIKGLLAGGAALAVSGNEAMATTLGSSASAPLKGNIRHSVSKWCFGEYPLSACAGRGSACLAGLRSEGYISQKSFYYCHISIFSCFSGLN